MTSRDAIRDAAWAVVDECGAAGTLVAAAGSALYPHVWARDVGMAALGITAAARDDRDVASLTRSLEMLAAAQNHLGRVPLKIDPATGREVPENSAGVDAGPWLVIAIDALSVDHPDSAEPLAAAAGRAIRFTEHLDLTGTGLLISPEASDWADMLPHRHHVLALNVLWAEALAAAGRLAGRWPGAFAASAAGLAARAAAVRDAVRLRFDASGTTDPASAAARIEALGAASFEWGITGQQVTALGDLPFFLPYVDFRAVGRHCDVTGNLLAVIFGVKPAARAARFLDYLEAIGAAEPVPTVAIDPPIAVGSPDYRDYFHWRNLNLPHCYQNGGAWPFIGALHVVAEVVAGRRDRGEALLHRLAGACLDADFPEWCHGLTGRAMGEPRQLWSASGVLYALEAIERGGLPRGRAQRPGDSATTRASSSTARSISSTS